MFRHWYQSGSTVTGETSVYHHQSVFYRNFIQSVTWQGAWRINIIKCRSFPTLNTDVSHSPHDVTTISPEMFTDVKSSSSITRCERSSDVRGVLEFQRYHHGHICTRTSLVRHHGSHTTVSVIHITGSRSSTANLSLRHSRVPFSLARSITLGANITAGIIMGVTG